MHVTHSDTQNGNVAQYLRTRHPRGKGTRDNHETMATNGFYLTGLHSLLQV